MGEEFWYQNARDLASLFACMHNVDPHDLGKDPQRFIAVYKPLPGTWTERERALQQRFVKMDRITFLTIYDTFRAGVFQKTSKKQGA
jgi:hypothetical protein